MIMGLICVDKIYC